MKEYYNKNGKVTSFQDGRYIVEKKFKSLEKLFQNQSKFEKTLTDNKFDIVTDRIFMSKNYCTLKYYLQIK